MVVAARQVEAGVAGLVRRPRRDLVAIGVQDRDRDPLVGVLEDVADDAVSLADPDAERRVRALGRRLDAALVLLADGAERPVRVDRALLPRPDGPGPLAVRPRAGPPDEEPPDLPLAVDPGGVELGGFLPPQVRHGGDPHRRLAVAVREDQRVVVRVDGVGDRPFVPVVAAGHPPAVVVPGRVHRDLVRLVVVRDQEFGRGRPDRGLVRQGPGHVAEEGRRDRREVADHAPDADLVEVLRPVRVERGPDALGVGGGRRVGPEPDVRRVPPLAEPVGPRVVEVGEVEHEGRGGGVFLVVVEQAAPVAELGRHGDGDGDRQDDEPLGLAPRDDGRVGRPGLRDGPGRLGLARRVGVVGLDRHVRAVEVDELVGRADVLAVEDDVRAAQGDDRLAGDLGRVGRLELEVGSIDGDDDAAGWRGVGRLQGDVGPVGGDDRLAGQFPRVLGVEDDLRAVGVDGGLPGQFPEVVRLQDDVGPVDVDDVGRRGVRHLEFGPVEPDGRAGGGRDREPQPEVRVVGDRRRLARGERVEGGRDRRDPDRPGVRRDQRRALVERDRVGDRVLARRERARERHPPPVGVPGVDARVRHGRQPALVRGGRRQRVDVVRVVGGRLVDVVPERPGRRRREPGEVRRGDVALRASVLGHARGPSRAGFRDAGT